MVFIEVNKEIVSSTLAAAGVSDPDAIFDTMERLCGKVLSPNIPIPSAGGGETNYTVATEMRYMLGLDTNRGLVNDMAILTYLTILASLPFSVETVVREAGEVAKLANIQGIEILSQRIGDRLEEPESEEDAEPE